MWAGEPFSDRFLDSMLVRLQEVLRLRSQHDELQRLLSQEDRERLQVNSTFDPFRKINYFYTNEYQTASWHRAMKDYETIMEPMEKEICQKLRSQYFSDAKASASQ